MVAVAWLVGYRHRAILGGQLVRDGQPHRERRPAAEPLAVHADRAVVGIDDLLDDRQPQAQAAAVAVARGVALREPVEHVGQEIRRDALPRVADTNAQAGVVLRQRDHDATARRRELDRVAQQVPDHLLQARGVRANLAELASGIELELDPLLLERRLHRIGGGTHLRQRLDPLERHRELAHVEPRHVEQVGNHARLRPATAVDRRDGAHRIVGATALLQHLGPAHDGVQRRTQLVRQHRDEVVLHAAALLRVAARGALAIQPAQAALLEFHALRHVGRDDHRATRLDLGRDVPLDVRQRAVRSRDRHVLRHQRHGRGRAECAHAITEFRRHVLGERVAGDVHVDHREQGRQGGVRIDDAAFVIEQRDAVRGLRVQRLELVLAAL